jgi:hypothetical protein
MCTHNFCGKNVKERDNLEYLGVDRRITSEWILINSVGKAWSGIIWLRI